MSGITGMRPNMKREAISAAMVATMKTPVPQKMPARALTMKKTTSGPTSTASFKSCDCAAPGLLVASSPMSCRSLDVTAGRR